MEIIFDFNFKLNKSQVFKTLKSYGELLEENKMAVRLLTTVYETTELVGMLIIEENGNRHNTHFLPV
ncbi:MAG: hypothetical protein GXW91_01865 [Clostridiales bacterium]|nr:hypothetical protein [Clostridiales bacterium]